MFYSFLIKKNIFLKSSVVIILASGGRGEQSLVSLRPVWSTDFQASQKYTVRPVFGGGEGLGGGFPNSNTTGQGKV